MSAYVAVLGDGRLEIERGETANCDVIFTGAPTDIVAVIHGGAPFDLIASRGRHGACQAFRDALSPATQGGLRRSQAA